jgi:hypothetical protein
VQELESALTTALAVWGAVVLADFGGQPDHLVDLRRAIASAPPEVRRGIEELIARKRSLFGGDPRILVLQRIEARPTGPQVFVHSTLPTGYPLASP